MLVIVDGAARSFRSLTSLTRLYTFQLAGLACVRRGLLDEDVLWARVKEPVPVLETVLAKRFVTSSQLARLQVEEHRCSLFLPLRGLEVVSELPHIA